MAVTHTPPFGPTQLNPPKNNDARTWRPLRFLNIYRFCLAGLFALLDHLGELPIPLGTAAPGLFYQVSLGYLGFSLAAMYPLSKRRPDFLTQLYLHMLADIIFITLWLHASGGISSGVGMLLVVSITNGSMIAAGRLPVFFAALASIAVLLEQLYSEFLGNNGTVNYSQAGLLGVTLFATAILAHVLARRARESEALARQRSVDLANMAQLTEYIIQQMQAGVMVVDPDNRVRLMNGSAWQLLGLPVGDLPRPLPQLSQALNQQLYNWSKRPDRKKQHIQLEESSYELLVQFLTIGQERRDGTLIFLEDAAATTRQAQQLKLASLGHLTGSIAHEIRNPLGAISHAGALLSESPELTAPDKRLTEIIGEQSRRINTIIEDVLQLGRRDRAEPETLQLKPWLERFLAELGHAHPGAEQKVEVQTESEHLRAYFDANQLNQLLLNLCLNGLRHSPDDAEAPIVTIKAGALNENFGYLDVIDSGPGIGEEHVSHIFEPFYTTESSGTGLGLYLSRELAENNQAQLRYEPTRGGVSRFRLVFRSPHRNEESPDAE